MSPNRFLRCFLASQFSWSRFTYPNSWPMQRARLGYAERARNKTLDRLWKPSNYFSFIRLIFPRYRWETELGTAIAINERGAPRNTGFPVLDIANSEVSLSSVE